MRELLRGPSTLLHGPGGLLHGGAHLLRRAGPMPLSRVEQTRREIMAQVKALADRKAGRDKAAVDAALATLCDVARGEGNMIEPMLQAVRVEATMGEICDALREVWGVYREPARF